jgi:protein TonB
MLQPASLFLKHGHLAQRVALLVREVSMSRLRLVASFAVVLAVLSAGGWYVVQAFPLTSIVETVAATLPTPPIAVADPIEPPPPPPPASFKPGVDQAVGQQAKPTVPPNAQTAQPGPVPMPKVPAPPPAPPLPAPGMKAAVKLSPEPFDPVAWEKKVQAVITRTGVMPSDPTLPYTLGALYWERAYRDTGLTAAQKEFYLQKGFEALDRALTLKPEYVDALIYKNLLLRSRASLEADPAKQEQLMLEADKLREQALKLKQAQAAWAAVPPNAVRVGGDIAPPKKVKDVRPVYPADAKDARVQGVVIIEGVIGPDGKVQAARVLRSVPQLDQAALDAVKQWEFTPTLLNGAAVPVVMTVTVNFMADGVAGSLKAGSGFDAPPPPPPPPPPPGAKELSDPGAVRVGGNIRPPVKITNVNPVYPPEAKDARVQGVVILDILIGEDGRVENAKILRSIPMLDQAAIDAVAQWVFTPTTINGEAKKVIMTATVNFTLQ